MSRSLPKSSRLLKSRDYRLVAKYGSERSGLYLRVQIRNAPHSKLGLTVSKHYDGRATVRNRFKRLVREAFRLSDLPSNIHINVRPRAEAKSATLAAIQEELIRLAH